MKDEVFEYFKDRGFKFSTLKQKNPDIKPSHIKAGMTDVYHRRGEYRDDQIGRAALRAAGVIDNREEYEYELKLNQAIKDVVDLKERNRTLKTLLITFYVLLGYFVSLGIFIAYPYMENFK